jgi:amylosucrase
MVYGFGGIPLLYMGDELALRNDTSYRDEPEHADDNRWMHRPRMPWDVAERRHDPGTLEGRVFAMVQQLGDVRRSLPSLHAAVESVPAETSNPSVVAVLRRHAAGDLVQLYNVSEEWQRCDPRVLGLLADRELVEHLDGEVPRIEDWQLVLPPYAAVWLTAR